MKLIISEKWKLVGYRKLPYILRPVSGGTDIFLNQEEFHQLTECNGLHDITENALIKRLMDRGILERTEDTVRFSPYQFYDVEYRRSIHWSITGHCNYRCKHCFMDAPEARFPQPSLDELKNYVEQMVECGIQTVDITGGEPLVRSDFLEIVDCVLEHGIKISAIYSNGRLVSEELMQELDRRNVCCAFQFSYDGTEGWHDWLRNVDGAETDVLRAFSLCRKYHHPMSVSMCVHKGNRHTLRDSIRLLAENGVQSVKLNAVRAAGAWKRYPEYLLSREEICNVYLDYIPQYFEDNAPTDIMLDGFFEYSRGSQNYRMGFIRDCAAEAIGDCYVCSMTRVNCYIGADGQVVPCMSMAGTEMGKKFPNLKDMRLKDIFNDSYLSWAGGITIKDIAEHNQKCRNCEYLGDCSGGCRATAVGEEDDDYLKTDEETCSFFTDRWAEKIKTVADGPFQAYIERNKAQISLRKNKQEER